MRGGYYVRTIIHFNNLGSDPDDPALHARAKNIMEYINSVYNPHGIYFVAIGECSGSPVYHDCGEPEDEVPYSMDLLTSNPPCNNALSIFDLGDAGTYNGWAYNVPGLHLRVQGSYNGLPASQAPTIIHEIGHALGLIHTYVGFTDSNGTLDACYLDPDECWDPSYPNLEPCICCEDNVCDTELTPNELVVDYDNDCLLTSHSGWGLDEDQYRNYMIGATANPQLTSQTQLCTDRFSSGQVARMRAYLRLSTTLNPVQLKTTAYSGTLPSGVYGNIVVKSGQTLEITSPVEMLPGASIRVEKGALLEVKSTVTGFGCDGLWRGIIVDGEVGLSQTTQNQGKVKVNYPGRIEHARIGIDVQSIDSNDEPIDGTGGGITTVLSGKFFNCITGIRFGEYKAIGAANISYLIGAEFTVNDDYRSEERPTLLDLTAITMLNIATCKFWDLRSNCGSPLSRAIGIDSKNASFRVSNYSSFRNLRFGIRADKLAALSGSYSVTLSSFTGCYRGISSNNFSSFRIIGNDFEIRMPNGCQAGGPEQKEVKGVELMGNAAGFSFYRNSFFYNGTALPDETLIGTDAIDLGEGMNNVIRENDYTNLHIGNRAMGYNGYDGKDGLVYLCNISSFTFIPPQDSDLSNYLVTDGSSVRQVQSLRVNTNLNLPAGNIFSGDAVTFNNLGLPIAYYYFDGDPLQDPDLSISAGLSPFDVNQPNGNCPEPPVPPCDPCTTLVELAQLKANFYQVRQQWLDKKAGLSTLTDTVAIKAKKDTIFFLQLELNKDGSRILRHYEQDTNVIEVDTILTWLDMMETYPADLRLASHYFFTSNFDAFDTLWNQISNKYSLQDATLTGFNELGAVYATVRPHLEAGGALHQLPQAIIGLLWYWADWCSEPGFLAQRLLWRNGIDAAPDCNSGKITERKGGQKDIKKAAVLTSCRVYPNPANESVAVEFTESLSEGKVILYNLQGMPVLTRLLSLSTNKVELPTAHLTPGMYWIEVHSPSAIAHRSKIIINH